MGYSDWGLAPSADSRPSCGQAVCEKNPATGPEQVREPEECAQRHDQSMSLTQTGMVCNLGLAACKIAGGWACNSTALTADGWHSMTDLTADVVTLATLCLSANTRRFSSLKSRDVEFYGSVIMSVILLTAACHLGWESVNSLYVHFHTEPRFDSRLATGSASSHSELPSKIPVPSMYAASIAIVTVLVKEWLYQATMRIAREKKSLALASNATHHRMDSVAGVFTLLAILASNLVSNAGWVDALGGLVTCIMVLHGGTQNLISSGTS